MNNKQQARDVIKWLIDLSTSDQTSITIELSPDVKKRFKAASQEFASLIDKEINKPATVAEAAKILNYSHRRVLQFIEDKTLKATRDEEISGGVSSGYQIDRASLDALSHKLRVTAIRSGPKGPRKKIASNKQNKKKNSTNK